MGGFGRFGQELELAHRTDALADGGPQAVVARVAATDHHDVEPLCRDTGGLVSEKAARRLREIVEREHNSRAVGRLGGDASGLARSGSDHHGVEGLDELVGYRWIGDVRSEEEFDPELLHERDATHHHRFLELHVGDAVHQQAAGTVIAFEDSHACTATGELPGACEARGTRPDDADARSVVPGGLEALRPAVLPHPVGDEALVVMDGGGLAVDRPQVAGGLAKRRAHAARELGQRRGQCQALCRLVHPSAVHEVVPLGNQVVQGTAARARVPEGDARLAERHAAHHAAARLGAATLIIEFDVQGVEVANALLDRS